MGVIHRAPPIEVLRAIQCVGTMVYVIPCQCKKDTTWSKYGNCLIPSQWHPTKKVCFAREVIKYTS